MFESRRRVHRGLLVAVVAGGSLLALLFATSAIAGPTVTVRVEGEGVTLLESTSVTLSEPEPVSHCPANSAAAAINSAVGGNWDHGEAFGGGNFTETILGDHLEFEPESKTWAEWIDDKWGGGICTDLLSEGDEVLMIADREPPPYAPTVLPLVVSEVPHTVQVGTPFTVKVSAIHTPAGTFAEAGQGTPEVAGGVTVSGNGVSAVSAADGTATLTIASAGTVKLRATKAGLAPSAPFFICAHNGNDGSCGTTATTTSGATAVIPPYKGPFALVPQTSTLQDGHTYAHGSAPRVLEGKILAHGAVSSVSFELRREYKGRCYAYDGVKERFLKARCYTGKPFVVSSGASYSYQLPAALAPGRYVLDIQAADAAGNHTTPARGTTRLVFYVR